MTRDQPPLESIEEGTEVVWNEVSRLEPIML